MRVPSSLILLLLSFVFLHASAGPLRRVPQQYRTIQSAINAARIGDTVLVDHGVYFENLRITKNIVLTSRFILDGDSSHIHRTVVDGSKAKDKRFGSTIFVKGTTDTTCVIYGLTIRGGTGTVYTIQDYSANKHWVGGGGIFVFGAGVRISRNIVTKNALDRVGSVDYTTGGGIACEPSLIAEKNKPRVIIEHNQIVGNIARGRWVESAGVDIFLPGIVRFNVIADNRSTAPWRAPGGGIGIKGYGVVADGNYIARNKSGLAGGVRIGSSLLNYGDAVLLNNIIVANEAFELAGGIYVVDNISAILFNNTVVDNKAETNGGGLCTGSGTSLTAANNIFWRNGLRPFAITSSIRGSNNLLEHEVFGSCGIIADPLFRENDSLFHLSSESPAIGTGLDSIRYAGKTIALPSSDFTAHPRRTRDKPFADLGAMQSSFVSSSAGEDLRRSWNDERQGILRLTLILKQATTPQYDEDSTALLRAGRMEARVAVNDGPEHELKSDAPPLSFILPPGKNVLEVELLARGLSQTRRLHGSLRLEGIDAALINFSRARDHLFRRYSEIPPGRYRLVFYAGDETGVKDPVNRREVSIIVEPYWYQRWWAYGLLALLVGGLVVVVTRVQVRRLREDRQRQRAFSQQQIEVQEAERRRVASELHDGLGQDLLIAKNELTRIEQKLALPAEELHLIRDVVTESLNTVRELSSNLHPHQIDQLGFCAAVRAMAKKLETTSGVKIICDCELNGTIHAKEATIHLYRIIQESLTNAVKHASASEIRVDVHENSGTLEIAVQDNGKGFDPDAPSRTMRSNEGSPQRHGFGIVSMSERARIIGGSFSCHSSSGQGTTIRVTLPIQGA